MTEHDLKQIVLDWQQPLYGLALRMLGNEADATDCTQDIFVKVFGTLPQYDAARPFKPWIYSIAQNVILDRLRRRTRHRRLNAEYEQRKEQMAAERRDDLDRQERDAILRKQLEGLDDETRLAVVLHYYDGMSQREVAEFLNLPQSTLNKRLADALARMRQGLQTAGFAMLIPNLEPLMQNAGPVPVPPALGGSLLQIATDMGATAAAAATELTLGGIVMTKKILAAAAALLCVVSTSLGYTLALSTAGSDEPLITNYSTDAGASTDASVAIAVKETDAVALQALQAQNAELSAQIQALREQLDAQATAAAVPTPEINATPEQQLLDSLDWEGLARIVSMIKEMGDTTGFTDETKMTEYMEAQQHELESIGPALGIDIMKLYTFYQMTPDYPNLSAHPEVLVRFTELLAGHDLPQADEDLIRKTGENVARAMADIRADGNATALEKKVRVAQASLDAFQSLAGELIARGHDVGGLGDLFMVADSMWNQSAYFANGEGPESACVEKMMSLYRFDESQRANLQAVARDYMYQLERIEGGRSDGESTARVKEGMRVSIGLGSLLVTNQETLNDYCRARQAGVDRLAAAAAAQRALLVFATDAQRKSIISDTIFGSIDFVNEIEYYEGEDGLDMQNR